jgi:hypothetical protein
MRDMRKWMNSNYISAMDLLTDDGNSYRSFEVEIERIDDPRPIQLGPKTESLGVARFRGTKKGLILRNVHMRALVKTLGPDVDAMTGRRITLYVEEGVRAFGDVMDCVRVGKARNGSLRRSAEAPSGDRSEADEANADALEEVGAGAGLTVEEVVDKVGVEGMQAACGQLGISPGDMSPENLQRIVNALEEGSAS